MPTRAIILKVLAKRYMVAAALAALAFQAARGQSAKPMTAGPADDAIKSNTSEVAKTLKAAAEALGLARWSGVGGQRLPEVDVINTMEIWGSGTTYGPGQSDKTVPSKTEYHAALGYNPPAMRVEMTRASSGASAPAGAAAQHTIEVVRDKYAWDE